MKKNNSNKGLNKSHTYALLQKRKFDVNLKNKIKFKKSNSYIFNNLKFVVFSKKKYKTGFKKNLEELF